VVLPRISLVTPLGQAIGTHFGNNGHIDTVSEPDRSVCKSTAVGWKLPSLLPHLVISPAMGPFYKDLEVAEQTARR